MAFKNQHGRGGGCHTELLWRPGTAPVLPRCHLARAGNAIIGFKCEMARAAITREGSETIRGAARKSLLNNELTSRLTGEFFVRAERRLRQRREGAGAFA